MWRILGAHLVVMWLTSSGGRSLSSLRCRLWHGINAGGRATGSLTCRMAIHVTALSVALSSETRATR